MDYPIYIDAISMELSILYFKALSVKISINNVFLSLSILASITDAEEMPCYAAFHMGLHFCQSTCFPKYRI